MIIQILNSWLIRVFIVHNPFILFNQDMYPINFHHHHQSTFSSLILIKSSLNTNQAINPIIIAIMQR
jgi:hypothetical protein